MSLLPKPLHKWDTSLRLLSRQAVDLLSTWLPRLSAWIGPYPLLRPHHTGEPAGYGDLDRRGDYQHLVTSEWLLADEYPEEFLRRAAHKEHLFYKLTRLESKLQRACFVFLDCGPGQLGKARLVQLALLIVMQRITAKANVLFNWAVIQQPEMVKESLLEEDISFFLASRSLNFAGTSLIKKCLDQTESAQKEVIDKEIWLVGDENTKKKARELDCLYISIEEVIAGIDNDEEEDYLLLQLGGKGQRSRSVHLSAPEEENCVALLRRPFKPKRGDKDLSFLSSLNKNSEIILSSNSKVLFALAQNGDYVAYVLNWNNAASTRSKPRLISVSGNQKLLAIDYRKGKLIQIREDAGDVYLKSISRWKNVLYEHKIGKNLYTGENCTAVLPLQRVYVVKQVNKMIFVDRRSGRAYFVPFGSGLDLDNYEPIAYNVQKWVSSTIDGALFIGSLTESGKPDILYFNYVKNEISIIDLKAADTFKVRFYVPGDYEIIPDQIILQSSLVTPSLKIALHLKDRQWFVLNCFGGKCWAASSSEIPENHKVSGIVRIKKKNPLNGGYAFITLSNNNRTLSLVSNSEKPKAIVNEESPITYLCQGMQPHIIAWKNALGRVKVYDIDSGNNLLIAHPEVTIETDN